MKRHFPLYFGLLLLGASSAQSLAGPNDLTAGEKSPHKGILPAHPTPKPSVEGFGRLPLSFEPNQGQADSKTRFLTHGLDTALSLNAAEAVFTLPAKPAVQQKSRKALHAAGKSAPSTLRMQLIGADSKAPTLQQQPLPGHVSYFCDRDPHKWHSNIPTFGKVGFQGVYPGVDVVYYGNQQKLEYDFVVAPHADPKRIQLHFAGAQQVRVNSAGDLVVQAQGRELIWQKPTVYQQAANGRNAVAAHFRLKHLSNGRTDVQFALANYDRNRSLVIDPALIYSSHLEGSLFPHTVLAVDSAGSVYAAGSDEDSVSTKTFVLKMNPSGTALEYLTYLAPTDEGEAALAIDSSGSAYIAVSGASTFPTTPGAYKTQESDSDELAVAKLSPSGSALVYSTFIGKNILASAGGAEGSDSVMNAGLGIAVDSNGSAYVTGSAGSGFPTTAGAFQTATNAPNSANAFVTKLSPAGDSLVYSTYLGGSADLRSLSGDAGRGIVVDSEGSAYIVGSTASTDFPTTAGAFQRVNKAASKNYTAFVTKLNPTGAALTYSTLLGGSNSDTGYGIALDSAGEAYVTGTSTSTDFPTTPGAYQTGLYDASFVTKLNATGSSLIYSTQFGAATSAFSIAIDSRGSAYITGRDTNYFLPTTIGAYQRLADSEADQAAFVVKFNPSGTGLLYSTYLGGYSLPGYTTSVGDSGNSIAVDSSGNVYVSGVAETTDFPTTPGAYQSAGSLIKTSFVTKLSPISVFPDTNNDGFTDLFLQNSSTGQIASWFMQGATWTGGAYFSQNPPTDYVLIGAGDFTGQGDQTLVLQSKTTNKIAFWFTKGTNSVNLLTATLSTVSHGAFFNAVPDAGWKVVGIGDFNGDGKSDLVLQNQMTGQVNIWFVNGYTLQGGIALAAAPAAGWQVVGVGDFNKDSSPDIAFQNQTTGQIALWYMNGTTYVGGTLLTAVPATGWKVVGVGDYNGDGSADLLFQNQTTNQAVVWYLQGGAFASGSVLSLNPPAGWQIVGPR